WAISCALVSFPMHSSLCWHSSTRSLLRRWLYIFPLFPSCCGLTGLCALSSSQFPGRTPTVPGDTGTYRCRYLSLYGQPRWSESSDPVRLVVGVLVIRGPLTQSSDAATSGVRSQRVFREVEHNPLPPTSTGVWPGLWGSHPPFWGDMPGELHCPALAELGDGA
uniref:Uncharacterized protein n=1 Tax=Chelonoidis abingdonii TaxID=106734 RepID=A0A8C0IR20_CHEAB